MKLQWLNGKHFKTIDSQDVAKPAFIFVKTVKNCDYTVTQCSESLIIKNKTTNRVLQKVQWMFIYI